MTCCCGGRGACRDEGEGEALSVVRVVVVVLIFDVEGFCT